MLTDLDDTLWHQLPTTFDHVGTSDPRFYDRYWFAVYEPGGAGALQLTVGAYNNMNVLDAGFVLVRDGRQHNLRVSRSLRPRFEPVCGPISVEVLQPLERFRLVVGPGDHTACGELEWAGVLPVEQEKPHFARQRGRVTQDYQRFDQLGTCSGWLEVEGQRVEVRDWWAARDHSWGVRPGMGVPEPVTGPRAPLSELGGFTAFFLFSTDVLAGHLQVLERGTERTYLTGHVIDRRDPAAGPTHIAEATFTIEMHAGTRRFRTTEVHVVLTDGRELSVTAAALGGAIAMPGLGYSGGFDDTLGLGVWRGDDHRETDVWDVSDPARVIDEHGGSSTPVHRIQPVHVTVTGDGIDSTGTGSHTLIANGNLPQYGLA